MWSLTANWGAFGGLVAVTLSPVMSSRFVAEHGQETRLTVLVNRGFDWVRRKYAGLLDGALAIRWAVVAASLLVMAAAWPLYTYSRRELAPVEDQSHISLFMQAAPDASLAASNRASLDVVRTIEGFEKTRFMWSRTANWGAFGGLVAVTLSPVMSSSWRSMARRPGAATDPDVWDSFGDQLATARAAGADFGAQQQLYQRSARAGAFANVYFRHYRTSDG